MFKLSAKEKILIHLHDHVMEQLTPSKMNRASIEVFSQEGIAESSFIPIKSVSRILRNSEKEDLIERKKFHVRETGRFRNLYFLTAEGIRKAKELQGEIDKITIKVREKDKTMEMKISDLIEHLKKTAKKTVEINYTTVIRNIHENYLDIRTILEPKKYIDYSEKRPEIKYFVGREKEIKEINDFMKAKTKILCIKGIAGIGKTTLLSKFIEKVEINIFWHKFTEFSTPRSLVTKLSNFLSKMDRRKLENYLEGKRFELEEIIILLEEELKGSNALFVFDDFHKANKGIVDFFSSLKDLETDAKMIVIGRMIPRFYDERDTIVNEKIRETGLTGLDKESSIKLLKHRRIKKDFDRLYNTTKGHPLMLELITPETKAEAEGFLREEIFKKLKPMERKALEIGSVFRYPFPAKAVMIKNTDYETIDNLIDKSLMQQSGGIYGLHDVIREFIYGRLTKKQKTEYHKVVAEYYENEKSDQAVIEAMYHYLKADEQGKVVKLAVENGERLIDKGFGKEFMMIMEDFEEKGICLSDWTKILLFKGEACKWIGEFNKSLEYSKKALALSKGGRNKKQIAKAYRNMGIIHLTRADYRKAIGNLRKAVEISKEIKDTHALGDEYFYIGNLYWVTGKLDNAINMLRKSLKYAKKIDDKLSANAISGIGFIHGLKGEYEKSIELQIKGLKIFEEIDYKYGVARICNNIGVTYGKMNNFEKAIEWYDKSIKISEKIGNIRGVSYGLSNLSEYYAKLNRETDKAKEYTDKALSIFSRLGEKRMVIQCHINYGVIYHRKREWDKAIKHFETSIKISKKIESTEFLPQASFLYAKMLKTKGDIEKAKTQYRNTLKCYMKLGNKMKIKEIEKELMMI